MERDGSRKRQPLDTTLVLSGAEIATLRFVEDYQKKDRFHRAPTHRELMVHLNTVLPHREHGGPAITSTIQTQRIAAKLRIKGYLEQVEGSEAARSARNLVATPAGVKANQKLRSIEL